MSVGLTLCKTLLLKRTSFSAMHMNALNSNGKPRDTKGLPACLAFRICSDADGKRLDFGGPDFLHRRRDFLFRKTLSVRKHHNVFGDV